MCLRVRKHHSAIEHKNGLKQIGGLSLQLTSQDPFLCNFKGNEKNDFVRMSAMDWGMASGIIAATLFWLPSSQRKEAVSVQMRQKQQPARSQNGVQSFLQRGARLASKPHQTSTIELPIEVLTWHTSAPIRGPWHHAWPCPSGRLGQSLAPKDHWGSDLSEETRWRARPLEIVKAGLH